MPRRTDNVSVKKRSEIMRAVRSSGNKATELVLMHLLRRQHITGWRRNAPLTGKPDFLFQHQRLAVFVDGCFWHGCPTHCRMPSSKQAYWRPKIAKNKARDKLVTTALRKRGWQVLRIWEHELRNQSRCVRSIQAALSRPGTAFSK
jgi:DNA mismatch endonuclease (patch repair protein)